MFNLQSNFCALTHLPRLLNEPGEEPSMPLLSGGVAPISQPTSCEADVAVVHPRARRCSCHTCWLFLILILVTPSSSSSHPRCRAHHTIILIILILILTYSSAYLWVRYDEDEPAWVVAVHPRVRRCSRHTCRVTLRSAGEEIYLLPPVLSPSPCSAIVAT